MDCILNELSLNGQFRNIDEFSTVGLQSLSDTLLEVQKLEVKLYKKSDFYNRKVTSLQTFHDVIFSKSARVNDRLRRMKSQLARLQTEPFWDFDSQQDTGRSYFWVNGDNREAQDVTNTSIAEAYVREACLISFERSVFLQKIIPVKTNAGDDERKIPNAWNGSLLIEAYFSCGQLSFDKYCKSKYSKKLVFDYMDPKNGFGLITKENVELFTSAFEKFEQLSWQEIAVDDGLEYKRFEKNRNTKAYFPDELWEKKMYKFRIDQKIRCFGYCVKNHFYVVRFDLDHKLSDLG